MTYMIAIIWIASNLLCATMLMKKGVKVGFTWQLFGLIFGPLTIPFVVIYTLNHRATKAPAKYK